MSENMILLEFSRPEFIEKLEVSRSQDQGLLEVWLQVKTTNTAKHIKLSGFDELAQSISRLLQAETVTISKEVSSGKEFGTIRIECWFDEDYSEHFCDSAK